MIGLRRSNDQGSACRPLPLGGSLSQAQRVSVQIHFPLGLLVLPGRDSCQCLSSLRLRVDELPIGALPIPKRLPLSVKPHRSSLANNDRLTVTQQHLFYDAISTDKEQNRQRLRRQRLEGFQPLCGGFAPRRSQELLLVGCYRARPVPTGLQRMERRQVVEKSTLHRIPTKQKRRSTGPGAKKPLAPQQPEKTWVPAGTSGHELSRPKRVSWLPAYGMMSAMSIPVSCVGVKTHVFMND